MISTDARVHYIPKALRFQVREAAWNHGYRRDTGKADVWLFFALDIDFLGEIALAVAGAELFVVPGGGRKTLLLLAHTSASALSFAKPSTRVGD